MWIPPNFSWLGIFWVNFPKLQTFLGDLVGVWQLQRNDPTSVLIQRFTCWWALKKRWSEIITLCSPKDATFFFERCPILGSHVQKLQSKNAQHRKTLYSGKFSRAPRAWGCFRPKKMYDWSEEVHQTAFHVTHCSWWVVFLINQLHPAKFGAYHKERYLLTLIRILELRSFYKVLRLGKTVFHSSQVNCLCVLFCSRDLQTLTGTSSTYLS